MKRTEMYTDGRYLQNNPGWNEEDAVYKAQWLKTILDKNEVVPASITEVGCGSGKVLVELSRLLPSNIIYNGYDISPIPLERAQSFSSSNIHFHHADYLADDYPSAEMVLVFDVIEHLEDYYSFLEKLRNKGQTFAFHIPLDLSCRTLLKPHVMMQQRNAVGHIHYFSRDMVQWLLADTGYTIIDWRYTKPITDTKPAQGLKKNVKRVLRNFSFSLNENYSADLWGDYSMMILAR